MNQTKIYVGNLSYSTSSDSLRDAFSPHGEIDDLRIITDFETGRSKGFGFITFKDAASAESALQLNATTLDGRQIKVSPVKEDRSGGGGGGGRRRSGGGNRGGGNFNRNR